MRTPLGILSLLLATALYATSAMASDAAAASGQTPATEATLEKINPAPEHDMKDCPMLQGKKECMHKEGAPCPYERDEKNKAKTPEKCDYKKQG